MCLYSTIIKNKKYTSTKKNGGVVPAISDTRVLYVPVGCGKCYECMKKRKREWQIRLLEEVKENKNGKFVTLTFNNESLKKLGEECGDLIGYEKENEIATKAVRYMLERWRKKHKKSLRHWFITELGHKGTERIHLHGFIWAEPHIQNPLDELEEKWQYGYVWKGKETTRGYVNYVTEQTINYITKYVQKVDEDHKEYKSKVLCSPGIGANYTRSVKSRDNIYNGEKTKNYYTTEKGNKIALTEYWKRKIYTDEQREQMWLKLLDKKIRYVNGIEIDISKGEENYYKTLNYYQQKNKRMGYGDNTKNWNRINYENQRREARLLKIYKKIDDVKITRQKELTPVNKEMKKEMPRSINWD